MKNFGFQLENLFLMLGCKNGFETQKDPSESSYNIEFISLEKCSEIVPDQEFELN